MPVVKDGVAIPSGDDLKSKLIEKSSEFDDLFEIFPEDVKKLGKELYEVLGNSSKKMTPDNYHDSGAAKNTKEKEFYESLIEENAKTLMGLVKNFLSGFKDIKNSKTNLITEENIQAFALCAMDFFNPGIIEEVAPWTGFFPFNFEEIDRS